MNDSEAPPASNSPFAVSATARRFVFQELRQHAWLVAGIFLGGALNAFLEVTGLALVFPLLAVVMRPDAIGSMPLVRSAMAAFGPVSQQGLVALLILAIAAITALKNVYMVSFLWWQSKRVAA